MHDSKGSQAFAEPSREASRMSDWDHDPLGSHMGSRIFTPPVLPGWKVEAKHRGEILSKSGEDGEAGDPQVFHMGRAAGGDGAVDVMELVFDPMLNCYYDAATNQYYDIK